MLSSWRRIEKNIEVVFYSINNTKWKGYLSHFILEKIFSKPLKQKDGAKDNLPS
nr:MAG TPA: hypothetical protein [Caudoviricetes sp.]